MIHYRATEILPPDLGGTNCDLSLYRESFAAVEASSSVVRRAKRAAEESLRRAQAAPRPHTAANPVFVALYEAHLRDREALFAAMRRFDDARRELRRMAAEPGNRNGLIAAEDGPAEIARAATSRPRHVPATESNGD